MTINNEFEQEKHKLLAQLLSQAQESKDAASQESVVNQIVVTILRSRPLCRRFNGTPLQGVYQQIYDLAKQTLVVHIQQYLTNPQKNYLKIQPIHLYQLQKQIFRELLNDTQLKNMGLTAQKYRVNSELRSYALTELVRGIKLSGRLCHPHHSKFSASLYRTLYEEAVAETLAYVCLNIDLYDQYRGDGKFMNWVNFKLDKLLLKCYEKHQKYAHYELVSFDTLEQIKQPEPENDFAQILQDYLLRDPEKTFTAVYIRNRPEANFSSIAIAKLSGQSWEQISERFEIPVPTLSGFYNRWCRRFTPLIETELNHFFE